ncbi:MAG: hypothetical protein ACE5OZ_26235 [Candidatus Heimdallarchaeota archaeon]
MLVVDNCSLSALQRINHLFLLKCLFSEVLVPFAVQKEFSHRQDLLDTVNSDGVDEKSSTAS